MKYGGSLVALEIEKTSNIWAERYFVEIMGFKGHPGITKSEFEYILKKAGLKEIRIHEAGGVLIPISKKSPIGKGDKGLVNNLHFNI